MAHYVYLASGVRYGKHLMKFGQCVDPAKRKLGGKVKIDHSWETTNHFMAENQLRRFALSIGAHRYGSSYDWFYFDEHLYERIRQFIEQGCYDDRIRVSKPLHHYVPYV